MSKTMVRRLQQQAGHEGTGQDLKGNAWSAAIYDFSSRWTETKEVVRLRQSILSEASGQVLEIGIGTGISLPYYRQAEKIVGVEPDPAWVQRARKRAQQLGLDVEFHQGIAEDLPFPDASFDTVVSTAVLCSVDSPSRALAEVKRVLKPHGAFRFLEHVRAKEERAARVQDLLTPVWRRISAGCHLNRRTADYLMAEGFEIIEMYEKRLDFLTPIIAGVAKPT